jgi:hypothetical protein
MPDRNRDEERDWSYSGPDYEHFGREGAFRRHPRPEPRPIDWDRSRHTGWDPQPNRDRDPREYSDYDTDVARPFMPAAREPELRRSEYTRGRFFGRGPKGYRRADERIREDVSDRLMAHPDIDASDIEVNVASGVVTLTGVVEDRHEKRIVEYLAEDVLGVEDVSNQLKVRHGLWARVTGEKADG